MSLKNYKEIETNKVEMNIVIAKDAFAIGGIGGIAGELFTGCTLENLYLVDSSIDSYYKNIAGVVASLKTADNNYSTKYKLRKVYADIDITSTSDVLGGLVGYTTCTNVADVVNGLFLGNVVVSNEAVEYLNRYEGSGKSVNSRVRNLYTLGATSFVNGWLYDEVDDRMEAALEKLYENEAALPSGRCMRRYRLRSCRSCVHPGRGQRR